MNVTEIAILRLAAGDIDSAFTNTAKRGLEIQNDWHIANFPHLPSTLAERASHCLQQIEDPGKIMITADWESVEAHWKWIRSEENTAVMTSLGSYFTISPDDMVLFHLDSSIFRNIPVDSSGESAALLDSPAISVERLFIDADKKDEFLDRLSVVRNLLEKAAAPRMVRGGWRVDVESEDRLEYVLVSGWESVEKHTKFSQSPEAARIHEIKQLAREADSKHYKRFL